MKFVKKIFVIALLIPLILFEAYLCTAFLPPQWQHAINDVLVRLLPESRTPVTHPMHSQEIELSMPLLSSFVGSVNPWN
jgi:hypothetical protein